jgi:hypothetical protein
MLNHHRRDSAERMIMGDKKNFGERMIEKVKGYIPNPTMIMPSKQYNQIKELEDEEKNQQLQQHQESGTDYPAGYHKRNQTGERG